MLSGLSERHSVLFQFLLVERTVVSVTAKTVQLVDYNEVEQVFRAVTNHLQELWTIRGLG